MKKTSIILGILLFLCVAVLPMETQAAETEGYLTYIIEDGEVTITDCDEDASGKIVIPDTIEGYPVTAIMGYAFSPCDSITSITIPAGVTKIGTLQCVAPVWVDENNLYLTSDSKGAVYSKDMKTLFGVPASLTGVYTVPDGVQTIASRAFATCEHLTQIILPDSVTKIDDGAFGWCTKLESVNIPAGVQKLGGDMGGYLFKQCSSLKSITIPYGVTEIPDSTFYECTALEIAELPDTITKIGMEAFGYCTSLKTVNISHVTSIEEMAFLGCERLDNITLAEGLTVVEDAAFGGCSSLTSIQIPSTVTKIVNHAFWNCTSLEELYIPEGVLEFGGYSIVQQAFRVAEDNPNYTSDSYGVLYTKDMKTLIGAPKKLSGDYSIPDGVTEITDYAFSGCKNLTGVDIPDSVTMIGSHAFSYSGLTEVPAFKNVTVLDATFQGCTGFTSVTVPEGVMEISTYAFEDCTSMTKIMLPASLKKIGIRAFQDCTALQEVISCVNKSAIEIDNYVEANDYLLNAKWTSHTWTNRKVVLKPTCATMGQEEVYCSTCKQTKIVYINKLSHNYSKNYSANAECHYHACADCGSPDQRYGHSFVGTTCHICGYMDTLSTSDPSTSTPPATDPLATNSPTIIPIPSETNEQTQYADPSWIIFIVIGVAVLLTGGVAVFVIVKKKRK